MPPKQPEIFLNTELQGSAIGIDKEFQATCVSRGGRPPAKLEWYLNDELITDGVSLPRVAESNAAINTTLYDVSIQVNRRLKAIDDRKFLICRSTHPADQKQEDRYQLNVRCKCSSVDN